MKEIRVIISKLVVLCSILISYQSVFGFESKSVRIQSINEVSNISRRADGDFDVTCVDNSVEVRTAYEVANDMLCVFDETEMDWTLFKGGTTSGIRFCDISTRKVEKNGKLISFTAHFMSPCSTVVSTSASCSGASCYVSIENISYSLNFSNADELNLTRLSDDFKGTFKPIE